MENNFKNIFLHEYNATSLKLLILRCKNSDSTAVVKILNGNICITIQGKS